MAKNQGRAPKPNVQRTSARQKSITVVGRPPVTTLRQTFGHILKPVYNRTAVRTLIKVDQSKGLSTSDAVTLPGKAGVSSGHSGGIFGVRILRKPAMASSGRNSRVVAPPRQGQGVLRVYNKNTRIRQNNRRHK